MTFRYFSEYGKVLPLPEVKEPKAINFQITGQNDLLDLDGNSFTKRCNEYNEWLSSGIHVPDEHLWYFEGVDRDESEFEVKTEIENIPNVGEAVARGFYINKVAIPKESKDDIGDAIIDKLLSQVTLEHEFISHIQMSDPSKWRNGDYLGNDKLDKELAKHLIGIVMEYLRRKMVREESKEQEDSPIEAVRDILNYIYAGGDSPYWMLKEVQMRLEKLITQ
jgi:hypothetical protein